MTRELPPADPTPEDVTYYDLCAEGAWNQYHATGDERYMRMCLAYFTKLAIAEKLVQRTDRDGDA